MRVRGFTQDDAHIFCTAEQVTPEVMLMLDLVDYVYYMSDGKMVAHGTPEAMRASKPSLPSPRTVPSRRTLTVSPSSTPASS